MVDDAQRVLLADIQVGMELEDWISSNAGRYIVGCARDEVRDFLNWALSGDASAEKFMQMRAKALAARTLIQWTAEQIISGRNSQRQLQKTEDQ